MVAVACVGVSLSCWVISLTSVPVFSDLVFVAGRSHTSQMNPVPPADPEAKAWPQ